MNGGTSLAPPPSAFQSSLTTDDSSPHPPHLQHLAQQIAHNLTHQHNWTEVTIHNDLSKRPLISGLPPNRLYVHPDEQIALLRQAKERRAADPNAADDLGALAALAPEREWALPSQLREKWTLRQLSEVFDSITVTPPGTRTENAWRTGKRVVLATLDDDGTVVYYIVHDDVVKPRQN